MKLRFSKCYLAGPLRTLEHALFPFIEQESPIVNCVIKGRFILLYRVGNKLSKVKNNAVETVRERM
jgi:hypothetical protein